MPLSREVFEQDGVSRAEPPGGPIADHDLHLASGEENGVLAARRIVPMLKRPLGERVKVILPAACSIDLSMSGGSRCVRVREVRIHPPPAESQQTFGSASSLELQNRVQHQEATNPPIVAKTHSGGLPASPRSRRFGLVDNEQ